MWMAGGGIKPGITLGETDDFGFNVAKDKVHVHDLHATILHLLGFDHTKLTYRFQGRDFRLTDVSGEVVRKCWRELPAVCGQVIQVSHFGARNADQKFLFLLRWRSFFVVIPALMLFACRIGAVAAEKTDEGSAALELKFDEAVQPF